MARGVHHQPRTPKNRWWTDEELLHALRRVHERYGRISSTLYRQVERELDLPSSALFLGRRFPSWNAAIQAAGLTPNNPNRAYTHVKDSVMLDAIRACAHDFADVPSVTGYREWRKAFQPDAPSSDNIRVRFGSWAKALEAARLVNVE